MRHLLLLYANVDAAKTKGKRRMKRCDRRGRCEEKTNFPYHAVKKTVLYTVIYY